MSKFINGNLNFSLYQRVLSAVKNRKQFSFYIPPLINKSFEFNQTKLKEVEKADLFFKKKHFLLFES
jgi:acetone carboxylase gamma subunit